MHLGIESYLWESYQGTGVTVVTLSVIAWTWPPRGMGDMQGRFWRIELKEIPSNQRQNMEPENIFLGHQKALADELLLVMKSMKSNRLFIPLVEVFSCFNYLEL